MRVATNRAGILLAIMHPGYQDTTTYAALISIWLVNIIWNGFVKLRIQQTSHISRTVGHIRAALSLGDPPQYTGQTSLGHVL